MTTVSKEKNEFFASRAAAIKAVDLWIGRGYVATGYVYNPEYAEQEGYDDKPYVVIICDDYPR